MPDNTWSHTARIVTNWLDKEGIEVLPWSVHFPDLTPIEHVWLPQNL